MKKTRQEYEAKIEQLSREFFNLPSEESCSVLRMTLRNKLWVEIWNYCKYSQYVRKENSGESRAEKYSGIINETIYKCFELFNPGKGTFFTSYLNAAISKEISREQQRENLCGMNVPSRIRNLWRQLQNLSEYQGISGSNAAEIMKLGISIGIPEKDIENAITWGKTVIISDIVRNSDGEEYSLFNSCKCVIDTKEDILDTIFETYNEKTHEIFVLVDDLFRDRQERIKPYLSALLTLKFFDFLVDLENHLKIRYIFIDQFLYNELKECLKAGILYPSQQDIAKRFKKDKTDASRTTAKFLKEVQNAIDRKCQLVTV